MQVTLDKDTWEIGEHLRLEEVLADLSDRARAKGHLVTKLTVANRPMTDRELVAKTLSQPAKNFAPISAESESVKTIMQKSEPKAHMFAQQINQEAQELVKNLRLGTHSFQILDRWLGQLADYLEWVHLSQTVGQQKEQSSSLQGWVEDLIKARDGFDQIRMADILEYEIIPELSQVSKGCQ